MSSESPGTGSWIELAVEVNNEAVEPVIEIFSRFGYNEGVVIEEPFVQDRDGDNLAVDLTRTFIVRTFVPAGQFSSQTQGAIERSLWHLGQLQPIGDLKVTGLLEDDWANAWKEHYVPLRVGDHILLRPPWHEASPGPNDIVIVLDPGMAFGTGTHPTTQLCLQMLERMSLDGLEVLDVGTGSGVLAIAASLLGAKRVDAVDIDPISVRQAAGNFEKNGVESAASVWRSDMSPGSAPGRNYDLVIANIIARILTDLSVEIAAAVRPGGYLMLSGIIDSKEAGVNRRYQELGLLMTNRLQLEDWIAQFWLKSA